MSEARHTLSIFDDDLDQLRATVSEMGGRVEAAVRDAVAALRLADAERSRKVVDADQIVDRLAAKVERDAARMIALRMPVAGDLRDVLACLRIAGLISRMGDCAKNIGHRSPLAALCHACDPIKLIIAMEVETSAMVTAALDSFVRRDVGAARAVRAADSQVDDLYAAFFGHTVEHMRADPAHVEAAAHLLFVAQKLERIADHATGIAEIVHFAATAGPIPDEEDGPILGGGTAPAPEADEIGIAAKAGLKGEEGSP